jgi:hypothetical protein
MATYRHFWLSEPLAIRVPQYISSELDSLQTSLLEPTLTAIFNSLRRMLKVTQVVGESLTFLLLEQRVERTDIPGRGDSVMLL